MFTRRAAAGLFGSFAVVGKHVVTEVAESLAGSGQLGIKSAGQGALNRDDGVSQSASLVGPRNPVMPEHAAYRLLFSDKDSYNTFTSALFSQHKEVQSIDPDLMVYKSFSPMAKVTFQRQRNVDKYIQNQSNESPWSVTEIMHQKVRKLVWGN